MSAGALWVQVDGGLLVGNDGERYLGSIEVGASGEFVAYGPRSELLGRYVSLDEAKSAAAQHVPVAASALTAPALSAAPAGTGSGALAEARTMLRRLRTGLGSRDGLSV